MKIFGRKKFESELEIELAFHLAAYVEDLVRSGVDRREAERRARVEFGAVEATKDECRQAWGLQRLDELGADLRYTLRTIRNNQAFASIAILALALGIGANTAIFGLVDAVLLRTLPVRDPASLVFIENVGTEGANGAPPYPCFEIFRDHATNFDSMAAFSASNMELIVDGNREQARGIYVSGNFYEMLGIRPLLGRVLSAADDQTVGKGGPDGPVAVISRTWWRQRFGGDPNIIGRTIEVFGFPVTIVGVMASDLMSVEPGRPIDIAVPMMLSDPSALRDRGAWWMYIVARLKPGIRPERARAEADALFQAFMANLEISPAYRKSSFDHIELSVAGAGMDGLRTRFSKPLTALLVLAGLVLLAACVTVANLMLARATARQKEFAIRLAIGAGRGRLIPQTLTEALVLVGAGAILGVVLAQKGEAALAAFFAEGNNKIVLDLSMNGRLLLFTLAISLLTGIAFGVLPAMRAVRVDPAAGMQGGSRSISGSRASLRVGRGLVVLQVALSMVLLAGALLFLRSLQRLESVDTGFTRQGVLTMEITPEAALYGTPQWQALQSQILENVRRLPGIVSAGWSWTTPLSGRDRGGPLEMPKDRNVHVVTVSPEYFTTFGIPFISGRAFTSRDTETSLKVAILNQTAARFYFGDSNPIGKQVRFGGERSRRRYTDPVYEIAGIVKDTKQQNLRESAKRIVYLPVAQDPDPVNRLSLSVRCSGDPLDLVASIIRQVRTARSSLLIANVSSIDRQVQLSLIKERLVSMLSSAFGVLALVLACIGLYGVLAYAVARRTSELGIRMALGATSGEMVWLILREAVWLALAGIALGIPPVLALGRLSRALLYGVDSFDIPAFGVAVLVLLFFALLAGLVPARRAGGLDPASALRCE